MSAVSALASVFGLLGWVAIGVATLLTLGGGIVSASMLRSPQAAGLVAGALVPFVLLSLVPFLAWGILRGLCEIHLQLQQLAVPAAQHRATDR